MVELTPGFRYVVEMEKDFMICGRKALMQISPYEELIQVKGVVNEEMFDLNPKTNSFTKSEPPKKDDPKPNFVPSSEFLATVPLD